MVDADDIILIVTTLGIFLSLTLTIFFVFIPLSRATNRLTEIIDEAEVFRDDLAGGSCAIIGEVQQGTFAGGLASKKVICNSTGFCVWNDSNNTCTETYPNA
ncbi:Transmembrane domain-containing protein [Orpheovirus IHUMI-LCC2]|uniref:Transmembrane domain-containing protein n=1 Tax=Orpheovirus IHUMI-LCC2 TaxID=2023057 RepID=A0A2I2L5P5_9VIRU|nr:Transmembrane domain-containing protein [Orpheovirus IHUMI-LCC2]SNW62875.1 Transmembrane domain-containing protein [Orpheovirus IHUMI-LCC2]